MVKRRINPFGKGTEEEKEKTEGATVEKEKEILLGADGSHSEQLPFEKVEIHVEGEAVKEVPKIPVGAFDGAEGEQEGEGVPEEISGEFTIEDCEMICNSLINIPAVFIGDYLMRTPEQVKPFATQLYLYCMKKGIDPMSYFFDEFGLVIAGANLAAGLYKDWKNHKEEEKLKEEEAEE